MNGDHEYTAADVRQKLREMQKIMGISQNALAARVGVTNGHMSRVLSGEKEPGPIIARWLGLSIVTRYVSGFPANRRAA